MPFHTTAFPFPIDGAFRLISIGGTHAHWHEAAQAEGFELVGRAVDCLHVVLGCETCRAPTFKRISLVLGHNPECPHCIRSRREAAAARVGAMLCGPDPEGDRHYGLYEFDYGYLDRRQHTRVEAAAAGGPRLSCSVCLLAKHTAGAEAQDWQVIGKTVRKHASYRRYEHVCGHRQEVTIANMRHSDVDRAGCGESWTSKPSKIYLLQFRLPELPVVKLGFSSNPGLLVRSTPRVS